MTLRPAKTQISLGVRPVWWESSLCAQWVAKEPSFLHADGQWTDQPGWMPRLIRVFAGCTVILLVLSWGGSFHVFYSPVNSSHIIPKLLSPNYGDLRLKTQAQFNPYHKLICQRHQAAYILHSTNGMVLLNEVVHGCRVLTTTIKI